MIAAEAPTLMPDNSVTRLAQRARNMREAGLLQPQTESWLANLVSDYHALVGLAGAAHLFPDDAALAQRLNRQRQATAVLNGYT